MGDYTVFRAKYFGLSYHIIVDYDIAEPIDETVVCAETGYHDAAEFDIDIAPLNEYWTLGTYSLGNQGKIKNTGPAGVKYTGGHPQCRCNVITVGDEFTVTGLDSLTDHWVDLANKLLEIHIAGLKTTPDLRYTCIDDTPYDSDGETRKFVMYLPDITLSDKTEIYSGTINYATLKVTVIPILR